jgi:hypothetical protein
MGELADAAPAEDAMRAFLATGAPQGEAFAMVAQVMGPDAALPAFRAWLDLQTEKVALGALVDAAGANPELAQLGLLAWGRGRHFKEGLNLHGQSWVQALPEGLMVGGDLGLDRTAVLALPPDLQVTGSLRLQETLIVILPQGLNLTGKLDLCRSRIRTLPYKLSMRGNLDLRGCSDWNGWIPWDTQVGYNVRTNRHPQGLSLARWRAEHPNGEWT